MFDGIDRCQQFKQAASKAENLDVTEGEFVRLAIASGMTEEKAKQTAFFNKSLGSHTLIGNQMLAIVDKPDETS